MTPVIVGWRDPIYGSGRKENVMTHACGCRPAWGNTARTTSNGPIHAGALVGQVARDHVGALDVMKALGINHCCGAGLTLAEAAAAAGVSVQRLLDALNGAGGTAS
jgi:hypothetical protein